MAQHIPINNSPLKGFQKIYKSICKNFENGIFYAKSSLKYEEIKDKNYRELENDKVFETWRSVNGQQETFEVHFDEKNNQLKNVYLVK
jgi:hypothetical protein